VIYLLILETVNDRIYAAIDEDQDDREIVECAGETQVETEIVQKIVDLIPPSTQRAEDSRSGSSSST
jgi:hypothetical protein